MKTQETKRFDAVTLGEVMMRLSTAVGERLQSSMVLERSAAGAELNVAVGLAQLGLRTAVCTKLPDNALSRFVLGQARQSGVSDEAVIYHRAPEARLGTYYFEGGSAPRKPAVVYDRQFSSFNTLEPGEIPPEFAAQARLFHTCGITLGLGEQPRNTAVSLMRLFKSQGALVSFDINYRANLWTDQEERQAVEPILPLLDILFISEESLRRMFGRTGEMQEMVRAFSSQYGIPTLFSTQRQVLAPTRHRFGALAYDAARDTFYTEKPYEIDVVDRVGSGDAFVSGALYAMLQYGDVQKAVQYGDAMAAAKCTVAGDLPRTDVREIEKLMETHLESGMQSEMDR